MALASDRAICLRKVEFSETSQILSLFSREHGLIRVIAKGAHRRTKAGASKFDGGIDLLDVGDAVFTHDLAKDINTLTEWSLREGHPNLRENLRGFYLGLYGAELVSLLIEERDAHPDLFDHLEKTLLEMGTDRQEEGFLAFEIDLLRESGYLAELNQCVSCGRDASHATVAYFSPLRGGIICRNCEGASTDRRTIDLKLIRHMQATQSANGSNGTNEALPKLSRAQTDPINRLLSEHVEHTLGRRMKMPRWVMS